MAVRFYLVPKIGTGAALDPFRPKYVDTLGASRMECLDYGDEPHFLVAADVSAAQHASLSGNADVAAFPQNLDLAVGANLALVQSELEDRMLPGSWVIATHTYRHVLFGCWAVMTIAGHLYARSLARIFQSGITLNTMMADLTPTQRNHLEDVALALRLDYAGVTGSTTVRQALRLLCQQLPPRGMMGEPFLRAA